MLFRSAFFACFFPLHWLLKIMSSLASLPVAPGCHHRHLLTPGIRNDGAGVGANEDNWNKIKVFCTVQNTGISPWGGSSYRPALPLALPRPASPSQQCRAAHAAPVTATPRRGRPTTCCIEIPSLFSPVMQSETSWGFFLN